ncbi:MAG: hypothetical protein IJW08_06425 [Lentisphaeria bacterium]|nr:hypothetical protein [Lentisphaeria bacterium]
MGMLEGIKGALEEANIERSKEQQKIFDYLTKEPGCGCLGHWMTDEEFAKLVESKLEALKLKEKALSKIGLDIDEVNEIAPVNFVDFVLDDAYVKKTAFGDYVSNYVQSTWIFFSATQVYLYTYTLWLDRDKKKEDTLEFFYRDITAMSTSSKESKTKSVLTYKKGGCLGGKKVSLANTEIIETTKFQLIVPGDKLWVSMKSSEQNEASVQAMKQKLREKKNA